MASATPATAIEALEAVKALAEGVDQWIEPYLVTLLTSVLDNLAVPKTATAVGNNNNLSYILSIIILIMLLLLLL
jgi:hypothetical protein